MPFRFGPCTLQDAIAAVHAAAGNAAETDWAPIAGLCDVLAWTDPTAAGELKRTAERSFRIR
jgi:RNA polymerase sigma-70 factor, ECF subfamily